MKKAVTLDSGAYFDAFMDKLPRDPKKDAVDGELVALKSKIILDACSNLGLPQSRVNELILSVPNIEVPFEYETSQSLLTLITSVFAGMLLGGMINIPLRWMDLGGAFVQAFCVIGFIYASDYLATHESVRKRILWGLGLSVALKAAWDVIRGASVWGAFRALRNSVSSGGKKGGLLRNFYVLAGSLFFFVLVSRKKREFDRVRFQENLMTSLRDWTAFLQLVLSSGNSAPEENIKRGSDSGECPKKDCVLAVNLIPFVRELEGDRQLWLQNLLESVGYKTEQNLSVSTIIWNEKAHGKFYEPVGKVEEGDCCVILSPYVLKGDFIEPGYVQRTKARK